MSARASFFAGFRVILPVFLGVIPFSLIVGVSSVEAGLSPLQALMMSLIVFAGASQLAGLQLISLGAPLFIIWLTTFFINLRFLMYSAALAPHFRDLPQRWRALLAYLLTDQAFAFSSLRFQQEPQMPHKHWYYLGTALPLALVWMVTTLLGALLGAQIPASWSLDFVVPLLFMVLVFRAIRDRPTALAALSSGLSILLLQHLPLNMGLVASALVGIAVGMLAQR